jgi:hypothetical protein
MLLFPSLRLFVGRRQPKYGAEWRRQLDCDWTPGMAISVQGHGKSKGSGVVALGRKLENKIIVLVTDHAVRASHDMSIFVMFAMIYHSCGFEILMKDDRHYYYCEGFSPTDGPGLCFALHQRLPRGSHLSTRRGSWDVAPTSCFR